MYSRATSIRLTSVIFTTQSLFAASQIAIITLLTIMASELGGSDNLAGIPTSVLTLSHAIAAVPIGLLMGKFGRRMGLSLSYGLSAIGALIGIYAIIQGNFLLLVMSASVIGLGRAGGQQSRFAVGELFFENERGRWIGIIVFAGTIGAIVGPNMINPGAWIATMIGINPDTGPWVIASIFYGIATLIALFLLYPEPMTIARQIEAQENNNKKKKNEVLDEDAGRTTLELLKLPRVQLAIISMLISQVVMIMLMVMTPLHMDHFGHSRANIAIVISAHTAGMFGFSWLTGYLVDRYGRIPMMVAAAIIMIASAIIAPLGTELSFLVIGLFLLGLGWNFGYVAGSSLLSDALEGKEKTRMQGTNDMLVSGTAALGSFSAGPLFASGGYITIAGLAIVVTILFIWIIRLLSPAELSLQTVE